MELRKSVKINSIVYEVQEVDGLLDSNGVNKLDGKINFSETTILIEKKLSYQMKVVALWHEILRAMLTQTNVDIEDEEKIVNILGYAIAGFIQDNLLNIE